MLRIIRFLPSATLSAMLPMVACANTQSDAAIFVCRDGEFTAMKVPPMRDADMSRLVRYGQASWVPPRLDDATSSAMAEGRGLWRFIRPTAIFESVGTRTSPEVLAALALGESGRNGRYWPWTINFEGRPYYFNERSEAVNFARNLLKKGELGFDVGLMQVHWRWNSVRFESIDEALDPVANIRAADQIIQEHFRAVGSMESAIGRYHSKTPTLKNKYLSRYSSHFERVTRFKPVELSQLCRQANY